MNNPPDVNLASAPTGGYHREYTLGAVFPLAAGAILYGWRGLAVVAVVLAATAGATWWWRRIGIGGRLLIWQRALWLGLLLALMLPPHLLAGPPLADGGAWALALSAGLLLPLALRLVGMRWSVHALLGLYLLLSLLFVEQLTPRAVLVREQAVWGDLADAAPLPPTGARPREDAWFHVRGEARHDAVIYQQTAAQQLTQYTRGETPEHRAWMPLEALLRDAMPPLEDLVVGGHPGPIGTSSAIAVLVGGLFLLYRRVAHYRVPLLVVLFAYLAFLLLPVPAVVTDQGAQWRPLLLPHRQGDWAAVITFANYQLMATPLLLVAMFIAPMRGMAPQGRWQSAWAVLLGLLAGGFQLYISASAGAYLAALVAGFCRRWR